MQVTLDNRLTFSSLHPSVVTDMARVIRKYIQVLWSIITGVFVNMMDYLGTEKISSYNVFNHDSVFIEFTFSSSFIEDEDMTIRVNVPSLPSRERSSAVETTKLTSSILYSGWATTERRSTVLAVNHNYSGTRSADLSLSFIAYRIARLTSFVFGTAVHRAKLFRRSTFSDVYIFPTVNTWLVFSRRLRSMLIALIPIRIFAHAIKNSTEVQLRQLSFIPSYS